MSAPALAKPAPAVSPRVRRPYQPGGQALGQDSSREARRLAAAILEVLAGARTPTEAATALSVSVPRYYQVESQALRGLLAACEARPKGRTASPEREVTALRQHNGRLQRELTRQQALLRAAQRTVGLLPPPVAAATKSGKKPRQRRLARALNVAQRLHQENQEATTPGAAPAAATL